MAAEYNLPGAGTIVLWMKKYEELGYNGLEGKQGRPRGRPKIMTKKEKKNTPLTNEEREELIRLRKEKEYLEMENFFGIMKNEMFYGHEYEFESLDQLEQEMIKYIEYYNKDRITVKLKGLSPINYRQQSLT